MIASNVPSCDNLFYNLSIIYLFSIILIITKSLSKNIEYKYTCCFVCFIPLEPSAVKIIKLLSLWFVNF